MEFRILGPLEVVADGRALALGGPQQRAVLAVLLLHPNQVVSTDRLIDAVWGERAEKGTGHTLQVYVSRLRKVLAPLGPGRLVTRPPGYLLRVEPGELDLERFQQLAAEGRRALGADAPRDAAERLREALALWRGAALADFAFEAWASAEAARLEELHGAAVEDRVDAELALGEHARLVGELQGLVARHPLRERLRGQLMLALYRSRRQAEALEAYQDARRVLVAELGIDPSPELQRLEKAILQQDPALEPAPVAPPPPPTIPRAAAAEAPAPPAPAPPAEPAAPPREERKVVTVLFADLIDFTGRAEQLDPEDVQALLLPYYDVVRRQLERFGGTLQQFIGDAVLALFGAPVAHEDDPERAVRAALAIREAIAALNEGQPGPELRVRMAVHSGEALIAPSVGGREARMVAGDVVNTASRLQNSAPVDGILVGESTYRATERSIDYRPLEPLVVKGKSQPVRAWEVIGPRSRPSLEVMERPTSPLVGREREVDVLLQALARVRAENAPQLVTIAGVPGIGKSRLLAELYRAVDDDPDYLLWRQGRSLPYGDGVTFWALGEMVKAHTGILATDAAEDAGQKLRQAVDDAVADPAERDWVEGHLRPLVGLPGADELGTDKQGDEFAAWRRFFEGLAERLPVILVFEDLHWADNALLDFIDHLVDWASGVPILVVCTARPELLERRPDWGGGKRNATTISLSPLSEDETEELVQSLLDLASLRPETRTALLLRAGGNPLYAEEYVRMLRDRGLLDERADGRAIERIEELGVPETVQGIIAARLDALPLAQKLLAQDAAVLGRVVWLGALERINGASAETLEQDLRALERREFVRRERRPAVAGETQYAFRHVLLKDVAYAQIPRARRAEKHRLAAQWIEGLSADRTEDRAEMLAYHYRSAYDFALAARQPTDELAQRARTALREAGDRAAALHANHAAARYYQAALELWPADDPDRVQLLLRLGRARYVCESAGVDELREARDGLLAQGDNASAAEAETMLGRIEWGYGHSDEAFRHFNRAVELVAAGEPSPAKAYVFSEFSRALVLAGEYEGAIKHGREAMAIAEDLGLEHHRASALETVGVARAEVGDLGGLDDIAAAIAIAEAAKAPTRARATANLAAARAKLGDLRRSFDLQRVARQSAARLGIAYIASHLEAERAYEHYWLGQWEEALGVLDAFITATTDGSPHYMESSCREVRSRIRMARGDMPGALADTERSLALARDAKDPQLLLPALAVRARVLLAAGRRDAASELVDELLERWEGLGDMGDPNVKVDLPVVLVALGRGEELLGDDDANGAQTWQSRWSQAAVALVRGQLVTAADLYEDIGSLPDEAIVRLRAAEQLVAQGRREEAEPHLHIAIDFFRQVDATAYLAEAEPLVAASV